MRKLKGEQVEAWRCQATDALKFSEPLKTSNLAQYWREFRNGNFTGFRFIRLLARGLVMEIASRTGLLKPLPLHGSGGSPPSSELGLRPGDLVQVRSPDEIEPTLDEKGMDRGLSFDREMLPYCGQTVAVKDTVDRIIDDKTGRMLKIPKDSLILEGAVCSGERTPGCWFCPREIYPFWREAWVQPVEEPRARTSQSRPIRIALTDEQLVLHVGSLERLTRATSRAQNDPNARLHRRSCRSSGLPRGRGRRADVPAVAEGWAVAWPASGRAAA